MIAEFQNEYRFLSNFYPSILTVAGRRFGSAEHAFQAAKCVDKHEMELIQNAETAGKAKHLGSKVMLRPDWDNLRIPYMKIIVAAKFNCNPYLKEKLYNTGDQFLIEGNKWGDRFWGICRGEGENNLGKILMDYRSQI